MPPVAGILSQSDSEREGPAWDDAPAGPGQAGSGPACLPFNSHARFDYFTQATRPVHHRRYGGFLTAAGGVLIYPGPSWGIMENAPLL